MIGSVIFLNALNSNLQLNQKILNNLVKMTCKMRYLFRTYFISPFLVFPPILFKERECSAFAILKTTHIEEKENDLIIFLRHFNRKLISKVSNRETVRFLSPLTTLAQYQFFHPLPFHLLQVDRTTKLAKSANIMLEDSVMTDKQSYIPRLNLFWHTT